MLGFARNSDEGDVRSALLPCDAGNAARRLGRMNCSPSVEVDRIDESSWSDLSSTFADANIYQTWPYEAIKSGEANLSHLVLKHDARVVAAIQARIVRMPYLRSGVAYVRWGPLSQPKDSDLHLPGFQQVLR